MDSEKLKTIPLKQLYLYYNSINKTLEPERAEIVLNLIREREISQEEPVVELAERMDRFAASLIDGILIALFIVAFIFVYYGFVPTESPMFDIGDIVYSLILSQVAFLLLNGYLLYSNGQTIGKRFMKIKIVDLNNQLPGLATAYGLRTLVIMIISAIPGVGSFFGLTDILFIFRNDRRCIHDLIAGTKVVDV